MPGLDAMTKSKSDKAPRADQFNYLMQQEFSNSGIIIYIGEREREISKGGDARTFAHFMHSSLSPSRPRDFCTRCS